MMNNNLGNNSLAQKGTKPRTNQDRRCKKNYAFSVGSHKTFYLQK